MDFQNRISVQSSITASGAQADDAKKDNDGSSSVGHRQKRLNTPSTHPILEVSSLKSPSECRIGSQSIRLFGVNLSVGGASICSVDLEKSKTTFGGSDLHSPKKSIFGSQSAANHKNMQLFGSDLCLGIRSLSSRIGPPSALRSQSTLGNKNIRLFGSDLCLGGKHVSHANQEKFKRTSDLSGLNSLGGSSVGSELTLGNKNIPVPVSNLCSLGSNISSIDQEKAQKTSGGSDFNSQKGSSFDSLSTLSNKTNWGSNLCLSRRNLSSINLEKSKQTAEISGLKSPSILNSQSNLCLSRRNLSSINLEKSKQTSEISGLKSPSLLSSQSNLCLSRRNLSSINLEKSKQTSEISGLKSPSILNSQSNLRFSRRNISSISLENSKQTSEISGVKSPSILNSQSNLRLSRSNLSSINLEKSKQTSEISGLNSSSILNSQSNVCLSRRNISSINLEKSMQTSEISGLNSPSILNSQPALGNKNIQRFESNLSLGSKYLSRANKEKSNQTSNLSGLHSVSNIGSPPSLGCDNILCFPGSNVSSTNIEKSEHTSEKLFEISPSLHFSPSSSSHKITLPVEDSQSQNHISRHPENSSHQVDSGFLMTEKVELTLARQPSRDGNTPIDLPMSTKTNHNSTPTDILEMTPIGNQVSRELSVISDKVEHVAVSSPHLQGTSKGKFVKRQGGFNKSLLVDKLSGETSLSQETRELNFASNDERQRESDDFLPDKQLFGGTSGTGSRIALANEEIPTHDIQELSEASTEVITGKDGGIDSEVSDEEMEILCEATLTHEVAEIDSHAEGNSASLELVVHTNPESDVPPNRKRKRTQATRTKFPQDIRSLLKTGILDGCPVFYYDYMNQVKKYALILRAHYLCGCSECRYLRPVTAQEFVRHCGGSNSTRAFRLISFKTGHSLGSLVTHIHNSSENMFKIISLLSGTVLNMENYRKWMQKRTNLDVNPGNNQAPRPIPVEEIKELNLESGSNNAKYEAAG